MNAISDIAHRVIDDHAVLDASADAVGGKAWQLAQLRRYGLPVAEFIVLPAAAAAWVAARPAAPATRRFRTVAGGPRTRRQAERLADRAGNERCEAGRADPLRAAGATG